jgi:trk system potassium uptake protein TrkH
MWLVESGPLGFAIAWAVVAGGAGWQLQAALGGAFALSAGPILGLRSSRAAGALITLGVGALLAATAPALVTKPLLSLLLLLIAIAFVFVIWSPETLGDLIGPRRSRIRAAIIDVRLSALIAVLTWLVAVAARDTVDPWMAASSSSASLMAVARAGLWTRRVVGASTRVLWQAITAAAVAGAIIAAAAGGIAGALSILALAPVATLIVARARGVAIVDTGWAALILDHPARLVVATFLFLCAAGTVLLALPACSSGEAVGFVDAAFTAVSAVCVTGLITLDTPNAWSGLGQAVILVLIQLGGLGIMTLSTAALGALGRRLSVRHEEAVAGLLSGEHRGQLFAALRRTLRITFAAELAGAVCLSALFWSHGDGFATGLWRGVFTAVSAFCNAGFALQSDSLIPYQHAPAILHIVAILIVAGGLSPAVIALLPQLARRRPVAIQVRIVVVASLLLLIAGFVYFAAVEWNQSLAEMSIADRLHNAWFQSVTFRTAGFNSIDFTEITAATLPVAFVLMFIGGAPGGTAGGMKVTTLWVLGAAVIGALRGEPEASSFRRRIPHQVVYRAIAIGFIGATVVLAVLVAILVTQRMSSTLAVFEVFSAVGTVGLSLGGTGELDGLGKVIIMVAMFLGRVGPLTAFLLLVERQQRGGGEELLEENVEVG